MAHSSLHPAFILHSRPYANNSLLLECFTASDGRFPAIAKGARGRRSETAGLLRPFSPLLIGWCGKGEVKTLTRCEAAAPAIALKKKALFCGLYINELTLRLLGRQDPHARLFAFYGASLERLAGGGDIEPVLRQYERRLLSELGYGLVLDREAGSGRPVDPEKHYRYDLEHGPVAASPGAESALSGSTLLALAHDRPLGRTGRREARALMRRVLAHYLGGRPLKSRELFRIHPAAMD